jgi:hypothetical protein
MSFYLPNSEDAVKVGDMVVLGRHDAWQAWHNEMDKYVGAITRVTSICEKDYYGKCRAKVEIDGGLWMWRIENMKFPPPALMCTHEPATCIECGLLNEYVAATPDYVCRICKTWREHLSRDPYSVKEDVKDDGILEDMAAFYL